MTDDLAAPAAPGPDGGSPSGPLSVPPPGEYAAVAVALFGDRLPIATRYASMLATDGVVRGLIGPRETPRIWDRHLLNCAVVAELIPPGDTVLDVGSGAGLPGLVLAIARPDLSVVLIEPLARRTAFLTEAVELLGLGPTVRVVRSRAEEYLAATRGAAPMGETVTARAVAPLDRLAAWCLPLTPVGGRLLALKGVSAADEIAEHQAAIGRLGGGTPAVRRCGVGVIDPPTTVVEIAREREAVRPGAASGCRSGGKDAAVRRDGVRAGMRGRSANRGGTGRASES